MTSRLLALGLGLALTASPVSAQRPDDLGRLLDRFATLWAADDASGIVELVADPGLDLEVQGTPMGSLSGRRAAAALRHLFGAQQTVAVRSPRPTRVAGASDRAFVEITWVVRPDGTPVVEQRTVFIGFIREGTNWKVSQIRILR